MKRLTEMTLSPTDAGDGVLVDFGPAGPGTFRASVEQLDILLAKGGRLRADMQPQHPAAPQGFDQAVVTNPGVHVEMLRFADDGPSGPLWHGLLLRHPGFGWIGFALTSETAATIGRTLVHQVVDVRRGQGEPAVRH